MVKLNKQEVTAGTDLGAALVLDEVSRARLRHKAGRGLLRVLAAQAVMGFAAVLICGLFSGAAALSALIGAAAYFIPNALFALRLFVGLVAARPASPFAFFVGEFFKLGSALLLLALAVYFGQGFLVWPALLFGLVCVLKGYVLLLASGRLP